MKEKQEKMRKPYTMTDRARAQRVAAAHRRRAVVKEWATVKIDRRLLEWTKSRFGTANEALETLRQMEGGNV